MVFDDFLSTEELNYFGFLSERPKKNHLCMTNELPNLCLPQLDFSAITYILFYAF